MKWRKIKTAPRTGRQVLISLGSRVDDTVIAGCYGDLNIWMSDAGEEYHYPKYWKPMPKPPKPRSAKLK